VLLFLFAIITGQFATAQAIAAMIKQIVIQLIIKKVIITIAKKVSPELAFAIGVAFMLLGPRGQKIDFNAITFNDVVFLLSNTANLISDIVLVITEDIADSLAEEQKEIDAAEKAANELLKEYEDAIDTNSLVKSYRTNLLPMMADTYYDYFSNFQTLATEEYEYDNKFDLIYERNNMRV